MNILYTAIGGLILSVSAYFYGHATGYTDGANSTEVKAQAAQLAQKTTEVAALVKAANDAKKEQLDNEAKARKAAQDYETRIATLDKKYDDAYAAGKRAGGLRIPASVCTDRPATGNQGPGTGQPDGTSSTTVQLPAGIEQGLYALAKRADALADQLRTLQEWIVANGFYGDPAVNAKVSAVKEDLRLTREALAAVKRNGLPAEDAL